MSQTEPKVELSAITDSPQDDQPQAGTEPVTAAEPDANEPVTAAEPDANEPDASEPVTAAEPEPSDSDGTIPAERRASNAPRRASLIPAVALLLVAVISIGVGVAFELRAHAVRSQSSAKNHALADTGATSEVIGQVSTALNRVLSYQYTNPAATQQAAAQLLTGDAAGQYRTLFTALQQKAPGEQLTLTAKVVTAAVSSLRGNTAQLLVFLDQSSTRASDKQTSTSAAQIDITAVKQGGSWKISELHAL